MGNFQITASANRKNSRPTIGVIKSNRVDYREILQIEGLKFAAKKNDVNLIIYSGGLINYQSELESTAIYDFVDTSILDGLIIWAGNINWLSSYEETESFIRKYDYLPVMSLEFKIGGVTSILWDDFKGMQDAIVHLIEVHKYKRMAFIRGTSSHMGIELRYKAYRDTLTQYGISIDENIILDHLMFLDDEEGARRLESLVAAGIDAIVSYNDWNARRVFRLMEKKNLTKIPIIGFDDEIHGKANPPYLTTVHPPFFEMGSRAVDIMLAKIKGFQVPDVEILPCRLVVRQTCGCSYNSVNKEETYKEIIFKQNKQTVKCDTIDIEFENIVRSIIPIPKRIEQDWASKLLNAFMGEVQGELENEAFIKYLETLLVQNGDYNNDMELFQDVILLLYSFTEPYLNNKRLDYLKAQNLLIKAINLIAEMLIRMERSKRLQQNRRDFNVISFTHEISNIFDMNELVERMTKGLKSFGILSSYLSTYQNSGNPTDKARLILAYNENGPIDILPETSIFPSVQLIPDRILPYDKRFEFILKPLYFQKRQLGFVLFEDTLNDLSEYEALSGAISTAINGVMMIEDLGNKTLELIKTNNELESAYNSLKENQQKLIISEKMASQGRLTAGIAHEMNTPLAAVRTSLMEFGELIDEYTKSIENPQVLPEDHLSIAYDMQKCLKLAKQATEKSSSFIKGMKAQKTNMNTSNSQLFNAGKVIFEALSILDFAIKKEKCQLITNFHDSIRLYGDPNRFVQIITNMVQNSIDACKPNGGEISISLQNNGDGFACLTVQDTGCGIPEGILSQIFDPMFTTKPFGEGKGLGLSIVNDLVLEFKGSINVESKEGFTSFIILLPTIQEE